MTKSKYNIKNPAKRRYVTSVSLFIKILVWGWKNPYFGLYQKYCVEDGWAVTKYQVGVGWPVTKYQVEVGWSVTKYRVGVGIFIDSDFGPPPLKIRQN